MPGGSSFSSSISSNLAATASAVGSDFSPLRIRTIPSTTSSSSVPADDPQPGLVADDDPGHLADVDRRAVRGRGDDHVVDVVELLGLDREARSTLARVERVDPLAEQAEGPDVVRLAAQGQSRSPPTLALDRAIASSTCCIVTPYCLQQPRVDRAPDTA